MWKIVRIDDAGSTIELFPHHFVRTPIRNVSMDNNNVRRLLNMYKGPKYMYFVNPNDTSDIVRVTNENIDMEIIDIFPPKKIDPDIIHETISDVMPLRVEDLPDSDDPDSDDADDAVDTITINETNDSNLGIFETIDNKTNDFNVGTLEITDADINVDSNNAIECEPNSSFIKPYNSSNKYNSKKKRY